MIVLHEPIFSGSRRTHVTFCRSSPTQKEEHPLTLSRHFHSASMQSDIGVMSTMSIGKICRDFSRMLADFFVARAVHTS
jgi:hypothetical protein